MACIFCDCAEVLLQRAQLRRVERIDGGAGAIRFVGRGKEQARRSIAEKLHVGGCDIVFNSAAAHNRGFDRAAIGFGDAAIDRALRRVGTLQRFGHQLGEGGVGALDPAAAVDDRHRHWRCEEDAGKAHLGGAQILRRFFARRAIEDERTEAPAKPS